MNDRIQGTGVALVTPFLQNKKIDFSALEKIVFHTLNGGVDYLVLQGTTGENSLLSDEEKLKILDFITHLEKVNIPIVFGLGGNNTEVMLTQFDLYKEKNVTAFLISSPYYNKPSQEGILNHFTLLADRSPIPIILYNVPHRTASNITAQTTLALSKHPNIIGIKEASGNLFQCSEIARDKPLDFELICGEDTLTLPMMAIGASGVISVIANAFPNSFCQMVNCMLNHQLTEAKNLHLQFLELFQLANLEGNPSSIKAALHSLHLCDLTVRSPLTPASFELVEKFKAKKKDIK